MDYYREFTGSHVLRLLIGDIPSLVRYVCTADYGLF